MTKIAKAFRLDPTAVDHLEALQQLTGSTQASIIEQALAVYRSLLSGGLSNAEVALSHEPRKTRTAAVKPLAGSRSSRPSQNLSKHKERPQVAPNEQEGPPLKPNQYRAKGNLYEFSFPVEALPQKGSEVCPCGSGEIFARCHNTDFKRALAAGLSERG